MSETLEQRAKAVWRVLRDGTGPLVGESALVNAITAALRREREIAVRECLEKAGKWWSSRNVNPQNCAFEESRLGLCILALLKPAAPVSPFGCDCWDRCGNGRLDWRRLDQTDNHWCYMTSEQSNCQWCGKALSAKPEVQP